MKKEIRTLGMAVLLLIFTIEAIAQIPQNQVTDVTTKGIQIGQKIPDLPYLSKYKGKFIILDFWATWCSPCVAMIPKMEDLQEQFKDKLQIIPVTYQAEQEVTAFLSKLNKSKPSKLPQITNDTELSKLFPHIYLPHYVWIDKSGTIRAITDAEEISDIKIQAMLSDASIGTLTKKADLSVNYDESRALFLDGNGGNSDNLVFHSVFKGYQPGLPSRFLARKSPLIPGTRVTFLNVPLQIIFSYALGGNKGRFHAKNLRFEVKDKSKFLNVNGDKDWKFKNKYCYELILPLSMESKKYGITLDVLSTAFPEYDVRPEMSREKVLALVRTTTVDHIKSKGGKSLSKFGPQGFQLHNFPLHRLIAQLSTVYLQNHPLPLLDLSGYKEWVDMEVTAPLSNVNALNLALAKYGLKLEERETELELLVFRDKI